LIKTEKILGVSTLYKTHSFKRSAFISISSLLSKLVFSAVAVLTATTLPVAAQLAGATTTAVTASASVSHIRVVSITPFKRLPIGGGLYDFSYQVALGHTSNTTNGVYAVKAELSSFNANFAVQMGRVGLDLLLPNTVKTSDNQITVRAPVNFDARFDAQGNPSLILIGSLAKPTIETNVFVWKFHAENDTVAPEIKDLRAEVAGDGAARKILIQASYSDTGSGIDTTGLKLRLNGLDVTSVARITLYGLEYTANLTSQARQSIELEAADLLGNKVTKTITLKPDDFNAKAGAATEAVSATPLTPSGATGTISQDVAFTSNAAVTAVVTPTPAGVLTGVQQVIPQAANPTNTSNPATPTAPAATNTTIGVQVALPSASITIVSPQANAVLAADALPLIEAELSGGNVDWGSLLVELDGQDVTAKTKLSASSVSYTPSQALLEGAHNLRITAVDKGGNKLVQVLNFKTMSAPQVSDLSPVKGSIFPSGSGFSIRAKLADVGSGIELNSIRLLVDSINVTSSATLSISEVSYATSDTYSAGSHNIELMVSDKAGNQTISRWSFDIDQPTTTIFSSFSPRNVVLASGSKPPILVNFNDPSGINPASIRLVFDEVDVSAQVNASATGISYLPPNNLSTGRHIAYLRVTNNQGRTASTIWSFEVDAPTQYVLAFTDPTSSKAINQSDIAVMVRAAADRYDVTSVLVNGQLLTRESGTARDGIYTGKINIALGDSSLNAVASYADGQTRQVSLSVNYSIPPVIRITAPADKTTLGAINPNSPVNLTGNVDRPVTITGTLDKPVTSVTINQQQATVNGLEFRFENFFLREGNNFITAVATDAQGRVGNASIILSVDQTAPLLGVESPAANSVTSGNTIDVRGTVNDAVAGYYGAANPTVTVSSAKGSVTAVVDDKQFLAANLPLEIGENSLTVTATDQVGNSRSTQFKVIRTAAGSDRVTAYAGHMQSTTVTLALQQPLVAAVLGADGKPLVGAEVVFEIIRGTGYISPAQSGAGAVSNSEQPVRRLSVTSDVNGLAQVWHTLGKQSGPGSDAIKASVNNMAEHAVFIANAIKAAPRFIRADLGINQFAATNSQPLEPLTAVVIDEFENRIPNAVVTFKVAIGNASFENGATSTTAITDRQGLAAVRPTIGADAGEVLVYATVEGAPSTAIEAAFTVQALKATDGATQFSGILQNDKGEALPGARMSIARTALSATTDEKGKFNFADVPAGKIDLFVDGRTVSIPSQPNVQYPSLHFEATAVKGAANQLPHPIYLPPLLMSEAKIVGGNEDVILKMPGIDGYEMRIFANSVTFPDGSKQGPLVVSPIAQDKLPMAPPGGYSGFMAPAATLQPSGTRFDPPAQLRLPNTAGFRPGEKRPVFQWDHDLGTFVQMGQATVTDDGLYLITDAGTGISKAGWHPIPDPPPPEECPKGGSDPKCKTCNELASSSGNCPKKYCKPTPDGSCDDAKFCTTQDKCVSGSCKGTPVEDINGGETTVELNLQTFNNVFRILSLFGVTTKIDDLKVSWSGQEKQICCESKQGQMTKGGQHKLEGKVAAVVGPVIVGKFFAFPSLVPGKLAEGGVGAVEAEVGGALNGTAKYAFCDGYEACWGGGGNIYLEATAEIGIIVKDGPIVAFRATGALKSGYKAGIEVTCDKATAQGIFWDGIKGVLTLEWNDGRFHLERNWEIVKGEFLAPFDIPLPKIGQ
jgi:Glucodextranase, domain B